MRHVFEVDLRALAALRVALGLLLIADALIRAPDLALFLTDSGFVPRDAVSAHYGTPRPSLHALGGGLAWQWLLTCATLLFAVMLALGWRTRLATLASVLLLASLHNRNPLLLQGGDNLLLLLLIWGLFLPLGARGSVDAALLRDGEDPRYASDRHRSVAAAGLLVQAMSVYFFSAFLKDSPAWFPDGTAIYYALHLDLFALPLAELWRDWHGLTRPLSWYVWALELVGPVLIFSPLFRVPLRLAMVFAFATLEIGFLLNLRIGLFPLVSLASLLPFVPTETWDRLAGALRARRPAGPLLLYFDDDCTFCEKTCRLLRTLLALPAAEVRPARSDPEIGALLEREFSWVIVDGAGDRYLKTAALARALDHAPAAFWLAPLVRRCEPLGDRVYHWIGLHRGAFGRVFALLLPWRRRQPALGAPSQALAAALLVLVTWWNLSTVEDWSVLPATAADAEETDDEPLTVAFPPALREVKNVLRLNQYWNMFAPAPTRRDGWFVATGELADGSIVDALRGTPGMPSFERPEDLHGGLLPNYRWRKYFTRLAKRRYRSFRAPWAQHVCRTLDGPAALVRLNLYFVRETTPPPGETLLPVLVRLLRHDCTGAPVPEEEDRLDRAIWIVRPRPD